MRYTAREGGGILKDNAIEELKKILEEATLLLAEKRVGLFRLFSAKHEFPSEWHRFLHPKDIDDKQTLDLNLIAERFPFLFREKEIEINATSLFFKLKGELKYDDGQPLIFDLLKKKDNGTGESLANGVEFKIAGSPIESLPHAKPFKDKSESLEKWFIEVKRTDIPKWLRQKDKDGKDEVVKIDNKDHFRLSLDAIEDIWIVCHYSAKNNTT